MIKYKLVQLFNWYLDIIVATDFREKLISKYGELVVFNKENNAFCKSTQSLQNSVGHLC